MILKKCKQQTGYENILIFVMVFITVSLPLIGTGIYYASGHDHFFHIQRILSIENALADGQFPVRIYKESFDGYGYGCPLFYPELFLYFPAVLCLLGCPVVISYNIFLILVNGVTLVLTFYSFSIITNSKYVGMIAAILYELSVYRLVDLYTRGSMGELLALTFCPLVLCGLIRLKRGEYKKWWVLAFGMSGVLQSHILTFVMMVFVCIIYVLWNIKKFVDYKRITSIVKAALLTVGLNLWFLVPFLSVSSMNVNAVAGSTRFWNTDAEIVQLVDMTLQGVTGVEKYGSSVVGSLPKTPGIPLIIGCLLFAFSMLITSKSEEKKVPKQIFGFFIAGLLSISMLTNFFPWKLINNIEFLKSFF